ncbi:hypothetical protein CEQ90_18260 [Lewinellaceae bacterium SD302]|nr:hypothetical protein CEQ90_18260 [Lewinellaceae bacterium SD302]
MHLRLLSLFFLFVAGLCAQTTINYSSTDEDFPNPERGFYRYSETRTSNYSPLNQTTLENYRNPQTPFNANYSVRSTLVFRYFVLDNYVSGAISTADLNLIANDFAIARAAGIKLIPRFTYTISPSSSGCSGDICPPYGDAPKSVVMDHIDQLQPILQNNADVIATLQMGFIGIWGENYYTDFFGDASQGPDFKLSDQNWQDRIDVLAALLSALPAKRNVQVRYPQMKQRFVYGIDAPTNSAPITAAQAYTGSAISRLGFHNDCLLASYTDFGTYTDYGNDATPSQDDTINLKPYLAADGAFVAVGGETCSDDVYDPENNCSTSNPASFGDSELERMNYSYLNADFNQDVNNDWQNGGCMDDIKRRLGYRFELTSGSYTANASPGSTVAFNLNIRNVGFTTPFNARRVEIILRNQNTGELHYAYVDDDPRLWLSGQESQLSHLLCLPNDIPAGDYDWLLALPDPEVSLEDDPRYNIRVDGRVNGNDVWEAATGFHVLGTTLTVELNAPGNACMGGEVVFTTSSSPLPVRWLDFGVILVNKPVWSDGQSNPAAKLSWATTAEEDNAGFSVQHSTDGRNFNDIGWLPASGNEVNNIRVYEFEHDNIDSGQNNYYRLRQEDYDGSFGFSEVRLLVAARTETQSIQFYPNPTTGRMYVTTFAAIGSISLNDLNGRKIKSYSSPIGGLDFTGIRPGVYILRFRVNNTWRQQRVVLTE